MAEPRDDRVSEAYRGLSAEGPPASIDAAIQAAARRAVGARPGGARPDTLRRWRIPVSIAAVLALAIGISLHVEREKPLVADGTPVTAGSAEYPVPQAPPGRAEEESRGKRDQAIEPRATPQPPTLLAEPSVPPPPAEKLRMTREAAPAATPPRPAEPSRNAGITTVEPVAPQPATSTDTTPAPAPQAKSAMTRDAATAERVQSAPGEPPEKRLEAIASLRARGLHDEADRALAEFRKAFPGYRISDEWRRRIEHP